MKITLERQNISVTFDCQELSTCGMRNTGFIRLERPMLTYDEKKALEALGFGDIDSSGFIASKDVNFSVK